MLDTREVEKLPCDPRRIAVWGRLWRIKLESRGECGRKFISVFIEEEPYPS